MQCLHPEQSDCRTTLFIYYYMNMYLDTNQFYSEGYWVFFICSEVLSFTLKVSVKTFPYPRLSEPI